MHCKKVTLHNCIDEKGPVIYTLFDEEERVIINPTNYFRSLRRNRRSIASQKQIANVIKQHCNWVAENSSLREMRIDDALVLMSSDDIYEWIEEQRGDQNGETGLSEVTVNNREVLTREMYRWFTSNDAGRIRDDIPWEGKKFTRSQHRQIPRFTTTEQVIRLLNGFHNESQRTAAHAMYDIAIRVSELSRLTNRYLPNEEDWPNTVNYYPILIPGSKPRRGKQYKFRSSIISRPMLARIRRYHSTPEYIGAESWGIDDLDKPVFLNVRGTPLTVDSVQKGITAAWLRQGGRMREISPHKLRHGAALSVLCSELGKELLNQSLRHWNTHATFNS